MAEGDFPKNDTDNKKFYPSELNERLYNPVITVGQDNLCDYSGSTGTVIQSAIDEANTNKKSENYNYNSTGVTAV